MRPPHTQEFWTPAAFAFLVLAVLCGLIYANALQNQFVFDDYPMVVHNPQIRSLKNIPDILGLDERPPRYRPVRFISYTLDYFLFGLDPRGYHLVNLLYHILTAQLVYLIVRRLVGSARVALLAAVLFAVHPIQTDAVTYISGRRDVLSTLFYLLGFYAFLRYRAGRGARHLALVFAAFVLGFFTKETVVTLPVMMLCYDCYTRFPENHKKIDLAFFRAIWVTLQSTVRAHPYLYLPLFFLAGLFLIEKLFLHNPSRMIGLYGSTYLLHFLTVIRILATYIKLLVFPLTLSADYSYNAFPVTASPLEPDALLAAALLAVIALGLLIALKREKIVTFAGLWFFITLLPVSQIVPHHELMAEHYLYLPSVGFFLLAGLGFEKLFASATARPYALVAYAIVVALFSFRTVVRNADWRDDVTLWEKTAKTSPQSARAHYNLGVAYFNRGEPDKALVQYQKAAAIWSENPKRRDILMRSAYSRRAPTGPCRMTVIDPATGAESKVDCVFDQRSGIVEIEILELGPPESPKAGAAPAGAGHQEKD